MGVRIILYNKLDMTVDACSNVRKKTAPRALLAGAPFRATRPPARGAASSRVAGLCVRVRRLRLLLHQRAVVSDAPAAGASERELACFGGERDEHVAVAVGGGGK